MADKSTFLHCRMPADVLAKIDQIASHHGLPDKTTAIRFLVQAEFNRLPAPAPKKTARKKSEKIPE